MDTDTAEGTPPAEPPAIRVEGLRKTFGDGEDAVTAVDGVSFEIERGSVVGLLGPNGAGKTTAIKSMLGLVLPDAGTVEVAGLDVHEHPEQVYDRVGAILEGARNIYWRLTAMENLAFYAGLGGESPDDLRERHRALLEQLGIGDRADTVVNDLSRGMKQKVSLATSLARDVDVVFMDEPTLGLDVETAIEMRSELRRLADSEDVTVVLCSHDMDVIETVCDRVLVLNDGSVVAYDEVDALLELFRTRRYRVTVESPDSGDLARRLERAVDAECTVDVDQLTVEFTATEGDEMYAVMDVLAETGQELREVESLEPDLEEVFLYLTGEDPATADDVGGDGASGRTTGHGPDGEEPGRPDRVAREVRADGDR